MIGLVFYLDDPDKIIRWVFPLYAQGETAAVLDDPRHVTEALDPNRQAVLIKVPPTDKRADFAKYISRGGR